MKEKALALQKEITRMKDNFDWLTTKKKNMLKDISKEYELLTSSINEEDSAWIESEFSIWYGMYLHQETVENMSLPEG